MKNIVHTIVRLRPDRLDLPLEPVSVGLFGSATLRVAGIPEDVAEPRITLTTPAGSTFEVYVDEAGVAYVEPGMLDQPGGGSYHVWATDAHGNPTPLGAGTLRVLSYPMSVPGSVRTAAIPVSSVMDENGVSRRLLAVQDSLGNWTLTVGDIVESSFKLVDPTKLPADAAEGDSMAVLKAKINAIKSAVTASCIALALAFPALCNAATLNDIPGTEDVYTAAEVEERINDVVTSAVKDAVLLQETDPTVSAWAKSPNPPDFSPSNATLVATIEATAPAPTNDYIRTSWKDDSTSEFAGHANEASYADRAGVADSADYATRAEDAEFADYAQKIQFGANLSNAKTGEEMLALNKNYTDNATSNLARVAHTGSYNDLSNKPTIPTVPTNVSAFNNDAGYLTGYTETDPTVPAWAKSPTKPSYTASEVGAVPTSRTVNGKALSANISLTASDVGAATTSALQNLSSQVTAISGHLNAEDARFVSTNYNSEVHLPEASVEVSVSNEWLTVWREMTRWNSFVGSSFNWASWGGFSSWMSTMETALDQKADRAWGYYDSHTGEWAPEGYTQVSSSNILIAAGMGYQRTVSSGHTYWVLTANEPYEVSGISSNGFFRVADADGNVQFEIIKGDKRTVPAPPDGVRASGGVLTVSYPVASQPTVEVSLTLADGGTWYAEDSASCPATVAWSGTSGAYVATVTPSAPTAQLFVKASYQVGGETFINNRAPISITGGIYFNGTLYMPTVNGNKLEFVAQ